MRYPHRRNTLIISGDLSSDMQRDLRIVIVVIILVVVTFHVHVLVILGQHEILASQQRNSRRIQLRCN